MTRLNPAAAFVAVLFATACGDSVTDPADLTYATQLGIVISEMTRTSSGLYYKDVTTGSGTTATAGRTVRVLYSGWLPNGTLFDEATDPNDPFIFQLGIDRVIQGWHEGVAGMRVGGIRTLVIPPSLGYGARANGPIPANSTLVFRIQLLAVQ